MTKTQETSQDADVYAVWRELYEANEKAWAWQVEHALPVKWASSDLDAQTSPVVMESLELAHHGLRRAT
jgi:phage tail-like protein